MIFIFYQHLILLCADYAGWIMTMYVIQLVSGLIMYETDIICRTIDVNTYRIYTFVRFFIEITDIEDE